MIYVKGDALYPQNFAKVLEEADAVVHTIGTLIDSTVLKGKKPGDLGSYEHMNRDTAISVGTFLN